MGSGVMFGRELVVNRFYQFFLIQTLRRLCTLLFRAACVTSNSTASISPFLIICHISPLSIHDMIPQFLTVSCDGLLTNEMLCVYYFKTCEAESCGLGNLNELFHGTFAVFRPKLRNLSFFLLLEPKTLP